MPQKEAGNRGISLLYDLVYAQRVVNKPVPAVFRPKIAPDTVFAYALAVRCHVRRGNGYAVLRKESCKIVISVHVLRHAVHNGKHRARRLMLGIPEANVYAA